MRKAIIAVVLTALAIAGMTAATAFGWHAEGVTVYAECQEGTYTLSASIQGSSDPGEYVKSISPSSLPGNTQGSQSVTVVIGWAQSDETQTFTTSVYLKGDCEGTTPPPPPPPCPNNPDGQPPNPPGGKDGNPGNDECVPDQPPLTIDTETTPTPPTETTPPVTEPPVTTEPPVQETVPPPVVSKNPPHITSPQKAHKPPKMPPVCPPAAPFKGKCAVAGQG